MCLLMFSSHVNPSRHFIYEKIHYTLSRRELEAATPNSCVIHQRRFEKLGACLPMATINGIKSIRNVKRH